MVGGQVIATVTEVPFVVLVGNGLKTCLGTLLTPKWILTAGHCVDGASFLEVAHLSGESVYGFANTDERADRFRWGVLFHPDYDPLKGEASTKDIALIEMSESLTSRYVRPVELPSESHVAQIQDGLSVTILGLEPANLVRAEWPVTPCDNPEDWIVCAQMSMAQHVEPGDSGGAVLMRDGEDWVLVGTTFYSYGAGGQLAAQRTSYYLPWIAQYVGDGPDGSGTSSSSQTITVQLGQHGGTAQFQMTLAGGFTRDGNPFSSGSTVVSEINGKTYRVTLSGTTGTAEFVAPDQVRLRLGGSGEALFIDENEDGTYTGTLAVNFEETTFRSGDLVRTSRGVQYRLTMDDGTWTAAFEASPPVQITLGASEYPIELVMTEDGGYTLNGNQFRSGDIVTTPTDSRYRLTLVDGEWQYTYVPPAPIRVSLGASGEVALLMRRENGSYEIGGTVITSGDSIQADNGNSYRIRFQGDRWTAAFVPAPPVSVTLGMSGLQISLARQEDGSYRHGNDVIQSGGTITAANGSEYRLTLANGVWRATYVLPRGIPVLLGISGELANVVRLEDGTYQVNGQPLGPDSTVRASNGNEYRIRFQGGQWTAALVTDPSVPDASPRVTITLQNGTSSSCSIEDLLTTAGASSAEPGTSVDVQVQGQVFRTVLLVECGQP